MKKQLLLVLLAFGMLFTTNLKAQETQIPCGVQVQKKIPGGTVSNYSSATLVSVYNAVASTPNINVFEVRFDISTEGGIAYPHLKIIGNSIDSPDVIITGYMPLTETSTGYDIDNCVPFLIVTCEKKICCRQCDYSWSSFACDCSSQYGSIPGSETGDGAIRPCADDDRKCIKNIGTVSGINVIYANALSTIPHNNE